MLSGVCPFTNLFRCKKTRTAEQQHRKTYVSTSATLLSSGMSTYSLHTGDSLDRAHIARAGQLRRVFFDHPAQLRPCGDFSTVPTRPLSPLAEPALPTSDWHIIQLFHLDAENWTQKFRLSLSASDNVVVTADHRADVPTPWM